MMRNRVTRRLWWALTLWLLFAAGCTTYAYVDFKKLRQTVPWISHEITVNTKSCPSFSIATEDGLDLNIPTKHPIGYVGPLLEFERLAAPPFPDAELTTYDPERVAQESRLSKAEKRALSIRRKIAIEAARIFSIEAFSDINLSLDRLEQTFRHGDVAYRRETLPLNQPGIGCQNGMLIIQQIFDGGIQYEGKVAEFIRAKETQFRVLPNGNLQVETFDLDWYGARVKTANWKKSTSIYERIR
ncbi:hypothetical protein [Sedimenticola hydrogenitrophicus]|uniref:hypothetical protein n=1 Tax=Sedimenticola hydrogenitrophicus TaxID=2967975 RepID=UPI0023B0ED00|nr:hypothetical protein [Sedimenticola hydrogenitrophicus]